MRLKDLYSRNLGLKFLALVLAVLLWFTAVGRERAEVGLNVSLEMVNFPPDMIVANQVPDGISIRIRGPVALTRQVAERPLRFSLDLSESKAGPNHFTLQTDTLDLPRGLEVTRMTPSQVTVELENMATKKLSLLPVIKGEPVTGYIIEDIILEPREIEVRGPQSLLETVNILWTDPIDVTKIDKSTTLETLPALPDLSMNLVKPTTIKVQLKIDKKVASRPFKAVPVEVINTDNDYKIVPDKVDLTVKGPLKTMMTLASGKALHVRLDLTHLAPGRYSRPVVVTVPPDMEVITVEPKTIEVEIFKEKRIKDHEQSG